MLYNHLTDEEFIKQVTFEVDQKRPGTPYVHLLQEALQRLEKVQEFFDSGDL